MYEQYLANGPISDRRRAKYRSRIKKLRGETIPRGRGEEGAEAGDYTRRGA